MRTTTLVATLMLAVASAATLLRPARMKVDGVEATAQDPDYDAPVRPNGRTWGKCSTTTASRAKAHHAKHTAKPGAAGAG